MTDAASKPGPDSTLDDVRERLIEAAMVDLSKRGVDIGLGHIKLADAIRAAGTTRSTAYRSLADDELSPQEVLHRQVLTAMLTRRTREANLDLVTDAVTTEITSQQENFQSPDIAVRTYALRSLMRVGCDASYHAVVASKERAILSAAYGSLLSSGANDWRTAALKKGEDRLTNLFSELYTTTVEFAQHRLRPGLTIAQFATAAAAAVEGVALRAGLNPHLDDIMRPTALDGSDEVWTLHGVMFEGTFIAFFEPIDAANPFADLSRY